MAGILIIGAGGVGSVVAHKCAQASDVFERIALASRTKAKCDVIAESIRQRTGRLIETMQVDADNAAATAALIRRAKSDVVANLALPYQDLSIMEACLDAGVHYLDTANYEPPDTAKFEYRWQWAYQERFQKAGLMALLGSGFDPGVTSVFTAWALKHHFDEIHEIDILDCNAGDHGLPFATNFNPEINIREVTAKGRYYEAGKWVETPPLSVKRDFEFPDGIGSKKIYLLYHEELESLAKFVPGLRSARFWMTFSDNYLKHLEVIQNIGLSRIDPVMCEGREIIPIRFLKALLPDPASLGPLTRGKTCIGCWIKGVRGGQTRRYCVYNVCDHQACYQEVGSQAISYTTGVPAMIGSLLMATGVWKGAGVFNMEQMDPDPFMDKLGTYGLPWVERML